MYESEQDYYEPVRTSNAFNSNYIKYGSNGDKYKILSVKEYLDMIRQYLSDIINDHKTQGEWKIQLTMETNSIFSKDSKDSKDFKDFNETRNMCGTSDDIEIMICDETDEIFEKLFESLLKKCQEGLEKSMKGSEFVFDSVDLLYYKLHRITRNRRGSYIDSPEWLKNKKATINPINKKDDNCFQYAITVALNCEEIGKNPERITKIKSFINKYNWKEIEFPSRKNDWKKFEKKEKTSQLLLMTYTFLITLKK